MPKEFSVAEYMLLVQLTKEKISSIRQAMALDGSNKLEGLEGDFARSELYEYQFLLDKLLM